MTEEQIRHMVKRFLVWRLPEKFNPDGGISFKRHFNEHTDYPMSHEPVGTNLFDATQAEEMVRWMVDGMPDEKETLTLVVLGRMPNGNRVGYCAECSLPLSWTDDGKNSHGYGPQYDLRGTQVYKVPLF